MRISTLETLSWIISSIIRFYRWDFLIYSVVAILTLSPTLFFVAPYNFTVNSFIGILNAYHNAGPLIDHFVRWIGACNNNAYKPERRLLALLIPFLICPSGLIIFGYTIAHKQSHANPTFSASIASAGLILVPSVMFSCVVELTPSLVAKPLF